MQVHALDAKDGKLKLTHQMIKSLLQLSNRFYRKFLLLLLCSTTAAPMACAIYCRWTAFKGFTGEKIRSHGP